MLYNLKAIKHENRNKKNAESKIMNSESLIQQTKRQNAFVHVEPTIYCAQQFSLQEYRFYTYLSF